MKWQGFHLRRLLLGFAPEPDSCDGIDQPRSRILLLALMCTLAVTILVSLNHWGIREPSVLDQPAEWQQPEFWGRKLAIFPTVFWEPQDTILFRKWVRSQGSLQGKVVLEIGTGSGLLALDLLSLGARQVVATDLNPHAVANAIYNARLLGVEDRLQVRKVSPRMPDAFSTLQPGEKFDWIVSNPPWENQTPEAVDELAWYDPGFQLLDSFMEGVTSHLHPNGRAYLIYGAREAVLRILQRAPACGLQARILEDSRQIDKMRDVFLPGMVVELTPISAPSLK